MLIQLNEENITLKELEKVYSKYENDKTIAKKITAEFVAFAIENNLILGYK
jgi:hypothetical protein